MWTWLIESFEAHRPVLVASFEAFAPAQRSPELRKQLADGQEEGRFGLAALFQRIEESTVDERTARTVGSFYLALLSGLIAQWLVDPERAPSGNDLAEGLREILASIGPADESAKARRSGEERD
jgi:Tetracyclin repressor-like, C-terminal domain